MNFSDYIKNTHCFEFQDYSQTKVNANFLLRGNKGRDPNPQIARLSKQFLNQNRATLDSYEIKGTPEYDGNDIHIIFETHSRIGALPLKSPTTGRIDYGIVIKPRFEWSGLGAMLSTMGWRVLPTLQKLPSLPKSERKIPPWVLSTIVLFRIQGLLGQIQRRFEFLQDTLIAPKGAIQWNKYITEHLPKAQFLQVPCRFPDLRENQDLKSAIHYILKKQLSSLESQKMGGIHVIHLIDFCQKLITQVFDVAPKIPSPSMFQIWKQLSINTEVFQDGLQAMEWTIDNRGLAGLSDLQGLPWMLQMETFFEAWIETVVTRLAQKIGGNLKIGRKQETIIPLQWEPPYRGSQKYLLPDVILDRGSETLIFDAKYKDHWEQLESNHWYNIEKDIQERHRSDLMQILAYANVSSAKRITACLVYPCHQITWESLKNRGRLYHRAQIIAMERQINLILLAVPINADVDTVCNSLQSAIATPN